MEHKLTIMRVYGGSSKYRSCDTSLVSPIIPNVGSHISYYIDGVNFMAVVKNVVFHFQPGENPDCQNLFDIDIYVDEETSFEDLQGTLVSTTFSK